MRERRSAPKAQVRSGGGAGSARSPQPAIASLRPLASFICRASLPAGLLLGAGTAFAGPQGGQVVGGQGTISTPNTNTTVIDQQTHRLAIDWTSFNVQKQELVQFNQPSSTASALNRIFDQQPSQIFGSIRANGRVILVNPNGVFFSPTARVSVGSLVASGLTITTEDFMAGNEQIAQEVSKNKNGIGYVGLAYAKTSGVHDVTIDKVEPIAANAKKYAYSRACFYYIPEKADATAKAFVDFAVSADGQKIAQRLGFVLNH